MQSLNEELQSVNAQLMSKVEELSHANDDITNLFNGTNIATIFLDRYLKIRRFTPSSRYLFHLISTDVSRPIGDIASDLLYDQFIEDTIQVFHTQSPKEAELYTKNGSCYLMRILPYRTSDEVLDGLVITFVDITAIKHAEQVAKDAQAYAESIVETIREPLVVLDTKLRVVSTNKAFLHTFGINQEEIKQYPLHQLKNGFWNHPWLQQMLNEILLKDVIVENYEVDEDLPGLGHQTLRFKARRIERQSGLPDLILLVIETMGKPK
jgi:two-component system CheB/CheR fusion protein